MYEILEIPAAGGFGCVCVARRSSSGQIVALKIMHSHHVGNPKILARTRDEARVLAKLDHPNIVRVFGMTEPEGRPVIEMELIEGATLEDLIETRRSGLPVAEAIEIAKRTETALDYAWSEMRLIHRDIKPSNILVDLSGQVKVVDFGIARGEFEDREAVTVSQVLGTRSFMAPERLDGGADRPSGDVYAMGLLLFELVTGERLLLSLTLHHHKQKLEQALRQLSPTGLNAAATGQLRQLIASMVSYFEAERPSHAECATQLEQILAIGALQPNLRSLASQFVKPLYDARPLLPPPEHPGWSDVAFLHSSPQPADVDREVRSFLARRDWPSDLPALHKLLASQPSWHEAPFLEILERAVLPWWKFWGSSAPPDQVAAALDVLHHRPTRDVLRLAARLARHPNAGIKRKATDLLDLAK